MFPFPALKRFWKRIRWALVALYFVGSVFLWLFGDDWVRDRLVPRIKIDLRVQEESCCLVSVEIEPHSDTGFEHVEINILLKGEAELIEGHAFYLDDTTLPLELKPTKNPRGIYVGKILTRKRPPIDLTQGERVEIMFLVDSPEKIEEVRFQSKNNPRITYSELALRQQLVTTIMRARMAPIIFFAVFIIVIIIFILYRRVFHAEEIQELHSDIKLLQQCSLGNTASLDTFEKSYQYEIDQGVSDCLEMIELRAREDLKNKIRAEIFAQAATIPKFRRSLALEIRVFVIKACVDHLYKMYKAARWVYRTERG